MNSNDTTPQTTQRAVLSINETADLLGISRTTLYRLLKTGVIERLKIGHRSVIRPNEIERFLDAADTHYAQAQHTFEHAPTGPVVERVSQTDGWGRNV